MSDFITLSCPNCGGKLNITKDLNIFACGYCGMEQVVNRVGGTISLKPLVEKLTNIQGGVDKTASELAIRRLKEEIEILDEKFRTSKSPILTPYPSVFTEFTPSIIDLPDNLSNYTLFCISGLFFIGAILSYFSNNKDFIMTIAGSLIAFILFIPGMIGLFRNHFLKGKKQDEYKEYLQKVQLENATKQNAYNNQVKKIDAENAEKQKQHNEYLENIQAEITAKKIELAKHREIVKS